MNTTLAFCKCSLPFSHLFRSLLIRSLLTRSMPSLFYPNRGSVPRFRKVNVEELVSS